MPKDGRTDGRMERLPLQVRAAPWAAGHRRGPTRCCGAALGPWGLGQAAGLRCCGRYAPVRVTGCNGLRWEAGDPQPQAQRPASISGTLLALSSARQSPQPSCRALPGSFGSTCSVLSVPPDGNYLAGRSLALPLALPPSLAACFPWEAPPSAQPLRPPLRQESGTVALGATTPQQEDASSCSRRCFSACTRL